MPDQAPRSSPTAPALERIVRSTPWLWRALVAARELRLPEWCIGAGAIRNAVWDALHGHATPSPLADVDLAYFDRGDLSRKRDRRFEAELARVEPAIPWEVTNQAGVHLWFEDLFGHAVEPLTSLPDAVASWPETATSIGVRLEPDGELTVLAPLGLDDLFAMVVRRNPRRVSVATYLERVASKRYPERWPRVVVLPPE